MEEASLSNSQKLRLEGYLIEKGHPCFMSVNGVLYGNLFREEDDWENSRRLPDRKLKKILRRNMLSEDYYV